MANIKSAIINYVTWGPSRLLILQNGHPNSLPRRTCTKIKDGPRPQTTLRHFLKISSRKIFSLCINIYRSLINVVIIYP